MPPLGETLRRARLKRNLELSRIADELKISASMLKAIEEEHFEKLPGGVFVRSFVRQYARLLELDEEEMVGALKQTLGQTPETPQPAALAPLPKTGIPLPRMNGWQAISDPASRWASSVWALGLVVLVLLACAGAYAWLQRERRPLAAHKPKPAAEQKAPAPGPPATPPSSTPAAEPPSEAAAGAVQPAPAVESQEAAATPVPASKSGTVPSAAAVSEAARPTAPLTADTNPDAPVRVEVVAEEESWVSLSADGKPAFTGVMDAGQSRSVGATRNVLLKIGNAGGVTVRLNGKPIGPLGAEGQVKTFQLTSGGFRILPPDVPKPPPTDPTDPANP